jgi:hypothetical protein
MGLVSSSDLQLHDTMSIAEDPHGGLTQIWKAMLVSVYQGLRRAIASESIYAETVPVSPE